MNKEISPEDLDLINRFSKTPLTAEEVYTFQVRLCDNDVDRDYERFDTAALEKLAKLFVGKSGLFDHMWTAKGQTARLYKTEVVHENAQAMVQEEEPFCWLKGYAYMIRTAATQPLIDEIEAGIKKEVSIGCSISRSVCSICGAEGGDCHHRGGMAYSDNSGSNSSKLCYFTLQDPQDAYEWSFVAVPAQREAGVVKRFKGPDRAMGGVDPERLADALAERLKAVLPQEEPPKPDAGKDDAGLRRELALLELENIRY